MHPPDPPRVFVGVDGSLASLRALHRAVTEARRSGGEVHVVYARPSAAGSELGVRTRRVESELDARAEAAVASWIREALGAPPDDVGRRSRRRVLDRSVGRYCLAHAECPVLIVPPDSFARSVAPRSRVGGSRRRDPWKQFDATSAG